MGADGVDIARTLRERRRVLGLTRARLAEQTGIAVVDLTKWERGEATPAGDDVIVLAEAIGLELSETQRWLDAVSIDLTGHDVSVELVESDDAPSDPFSGRITPLREEGGVLARIADRLAKREERRAESGEAPVTPIRKPTPPRPAPSTSSGLVRQPARAAHALPSVFPEPAIAPYDPEARVYATGPLRPLSDEEEQFYLLRRIRTAAVLIGLGVALWWAVGTLWSGLGDVLDLFRGPVGG